MLEGTKKLFPEDYNDFKDAMIQAAENNILPIALSLKEDKNFTLNDFREMFMDFKQDTGLQISALLSMNDINNKINVIIEIDFPETEEKTLLQ